MSSDTPAKTPVVLIRARSCLQRVWSEFPHVTFNQGNVGPGLRHVDEEVLIFLVLALRGPAGAFPSVSANTRVDDTIDACPASDSPRYRRPPTTKTPPAEPTGRVAAGARFSINPAPYDRNRWRTRALPSSV